MNVVDLPLQGLKLVEPKVFRDERGFFLETYRKDLLAKAGIDVDFVQDNHSRSTKNTIRGLHFQRMPGQAKLVRVATGKILDVAVDLRPSSPTFKHWYAETLDAESMKALYVPVGFAHGFCVLSEVADVIYKVSAVYDPATETGFMYDDPAVGVRWPISREQALLSARDANAKRLSEIQI